MKLSCENDTIQFPENIGKLILERVVMLSESEGIFTGDDILKIKERNGPKK